MLDLFGSLSLLSRASWNSRAAFYRDSLSLGEIETEERFIFIFETSELKQLKLIKRWFESALLFAL